MRKKIIAPFVALLVTVLSGCASTNDIDLSGKDSVCGQTCTTNYTSCVNVSSWFPIQQQHECADALRKCAQTCPSRSTSTATPSDKPSVTDKLKELDSMHKSGLITDSEYAAKRQEILKGM